jgi:hypothetical protein
MKKVILRTERPEGILLTMPERFFQHYPGGLDQYRKILEGMNETDKYTWGNTIANIPSIEVPYCFLVFGGKVQYRTEIVGYQRNITREYSDGGITRIFENKNWVDLQGPVIKAPFDIPMKGFRGFRYTSLLF